MRKLNILFYDLETSALNGDSWTKNFRNGGSLLNVRKHRELLSCAYSCGNSIEFVRRGSGKSDFSITKKIVKLYNEADVVIAHNAKGFDNKVLRTRSIFHNIDPLARNTVIDTLEVARAGFLFSGNSLDDLANFFGIGRKLPTPGYSLWERCYEDDPKAWKLMEKYNKHDVYLLKKVYDRMRPYLESHPHWGKILRPYSKEVSCQHCGSNQHMYARGYRATAMGIKRQWTCHSCRGWTTTPLTAKRRSK